MRVTPRATREHMPFRRHRTCAEWGADAFWEALGQHGNVSLAMQCSGLTPTEAQRELRKYANDLAA
jgi:hypothetical protein